MKKHATDVVALSLGCAFLALVAVWGLAKAVTIDLPSGGWFVAALFVVIGVVALAATLRPNKS
jgi:hypothetical protein